MYPEGNYIRASDDRPFLQIGESKYGKFMLELAVLAHADLVTSLKIALSSMMSTAHANLSVGPPYDPAVYRNGAFDLDEHRFTAESPVLGELREVWERNILNAVGQLPDVGLSELRAADGRGPTELGALHRDRGAVGGDLGHVASELVAVEAHRDDRVRAGLARGVAKPLDRLQAAVREHLRVALDLASDEPLEARSDVGADVPAADGEPEHLAVDVRDRGTPAGRSWS